MHSNPPAPTPRESVRGPTIGEWLCLVLGLFLVWRYRWIFDDSFVYFRYVDNLLFLRAGLTFNAGEYVEGFSSPLHCLLLICLRFFQLGYPTIILLVGLVGFTLFWWILVCVNRALLPEEASASGRFNLPLAYLAANYSVTSFFTAGNEGPLLHLLAVSSAYLLLYPRSYWATIAVSLGPLVRPELILALAFTLAFLWIGQRRVPWLLIICAVLANGGWLLFRVIYYADLLPNTYYLKVGTELEGEPLWQAGLRYLMDTAGPPQFFPVLAVAGIFALGLAIGSNQSNAWRRLRCEPRCGMLLIALALGLWTVLSGGSSMSYYYLAFPFTLAVCAMGGLIEQTLQPWLAKAPVLANFGLTLLVVGFVFTRYPQTLSAHPVTGRERMHPLPSPKVLTDPAFFRHRPALADPWPAIDAMQAFVPQLKATGYTSWTDVAACNTLYRNFNVRSIHSFGLTDAVLARVETKEQKRGHKPALAGLALDLIEVQMAAGGGGPGVYSAAIEAGTAPPWLSSNRETVEYLEAKIFNSHQLLRNLHIAFTFPDAIQVKPRPR